ncbi:major facilitator superfamily domain-containing protein [Mycena floridula]|nr:major facilitator superfamily domain-containing protein [Mycena floridula]
MSPRTLVNIDNFDEVAEHGVVVESLKSDQSEYDEYLALKAYYENNPREHSRLLRKIDLRLIPILSFLYLLCSLDKANAGNAKLYGFLEDLHMTGRQFNLGLTVFFFTYGASELPANIMLRRLGPRIWLPIIVCLWGLITALTSLITNYRSFIGIRLALGVAEAGMYPGAFFILSCWYLPHELQTRMGFFYGANTLAGAFGGVLAYGIGRLDFHDGWKAWRWLFLIQGAITVAAGLLAHFALSDLPYSFKQSWLGGSELRYIILRARYHAGRTPPDLRFKWADVLAALKDWKVYPIMSMFWFGGLSYTLPTLVRNLGYNAIKSQALHHTAICEFFVFATIVCVSVALWSDKHKSRMKAIMFSYSLGLSGIIILWITVSHPHLTGVSYFAIFLAAAGYAAQAPGIGCLARQQHCFPDKVSFFTVCSVSMAHQLFRRAAAIGFMMTFGSIGGGSIGANIYLAEQAPTYPLGFGFSIGATVLGAMVPCMLNWYFLRKENRRRDTLNQGDWD